MDFSFGIITAGNNDKNIQLIIESIEKQSIPNYEIIIIGNSAITGDKIIQVPFNEKTKKAWITKKKNLVTQHASYENVVYFHDYMILDDNWYKGFLEFGNDFKLCMNVILDDKGERFRDWTLWELDIKGFKIPNNERLIPYEETRLSKWMYFSGAYWVAKKSVMQEFPLNERLVWGQGEDVIWSQLVRQKYDFSMNANSIVKIIKPNKPKVFNYMSEDTYRNKLLPHIENKMKLSNK